MTITEKIRKALDGMDDCDLIAINREYLDNVNGWDNTIYNMEDLNEILDGSTPEKIARLIFYGEFNPNADYFTFNGYGNLQSIWSYELREYIYIDEIIDYIVENNDPLYNDEIEAILEEDAEQ